MKNHEKYLINIVCLIFFVYSVNCTTSDGFSNLIKSFLFSDNITNITDPEIELYNQFDSKGDSGIFDFLKKIGSIFSKDEHSPYNNQSEKTINFDYVYSSREWTETYSTDINYNTNYRKKLRADTNSTQNEPNISNKINKKDPTNIIYLTNMMQLSNSTDNENVSQNILSYIDFGFGNNPLQSGTTKKDEIEFTRNAMSLESVPTTQDTVTENVDEKIILSTTMIVPKESLKTVLDNYNDKDYGDQFTDYAYIDHYYVERNKLLSQVTSSTESREPDPSDYDFQFSILPVEAMNLCRTSKKQRTFITVERVVGLPVEEENYWNGTFEPGRFGNLTKVEMVLQLTSSVNVSTDSDNVITTRLNDTTFLIKGLNATEPVYFKVQALPGQSFPFVKKVTLNGREICKKKRPWKPTLYGRQEQAVLSPLESPHEFGPYFCGRSKIDFTPLVVKGLPTKEGDYPWHVAIFIRNPMTMNWDYACGGTIMTHKTIITAAHCVVNKDSVHIPKERLLIVAGKYRLYDVDRNQYPLKIEQIIVHENYTQAGNTLVHDLALLITEDSIEYGMYVQPICQWNKKQADREVIFQEFGTVVGWGSTENETLAETLLAASLRAVPDSICLKSRPSFFKRYLTMDTFCAGNRNGTSACNGDSGGGLIFPITELDGRQSWYLRGVVSAGVRRAGGLCDPKHYVVFTDVVRYSQWIEENQQL